MESRDASSDHALIELLRPVRTARTSLKLRHFSRECGVPVLELAVFARGFGAIPDLPVFTFTEDSQHG